MSNTIYEEARVVYADGPTSSPTNPPKSAIRHLNKTIAVAVESASIGRIDQVTWSDLSAITGTDEGQPARVIGPDTGTHTDPVAGGTVTNIGEYIWSASPAGWRRTGGLVRDLVYASNANSGDADAVTATSDGAFDTTAGKALITVNFVATNTGAMTLSIDGETPRDLVTNTGAAIPSGYVQAGMSALVQIDSAGNYRLFSYGDATAIQSAAEAAKEAAEDAQAAAEAAAAGVNMPSITSDDAGKSLVVKSDLSGYELEFNGPASFTYELQAVDYGLGTGGDDVAAMNLLVAAINALGSATRSDYKNIRVSFHAGTYDLRDVNADGIDPILVSNVCFDCEKGTHFRLQKAPIAKLGSSSVFVENFWLIAPSAHSATSDTLTGDAALVYGINHARCFIERPQVYRVPHLYKAVAPSGATISTIYINTPYGLGHPDYHWVDINTEDATAAAGLFILNPGGYPYAPPANPKIVPASISAITKATNAKITTTAAHGFTTGDTVQIGSVAGMTEINDTVDTITVVDSTSFTLDSTDSTGFTTYSSSGKAAELHWARDYLTAAISIQGKWDTARIIGGVLQHWAYLWRVYATGSVSFIEDNDVVWDYGGEGRYDFTFAGGSISHVWCRGGWTFTLNGDFIKRTAGGLGFLLDMRVSDHVVGLLGGDFVSEATGRILDIFFDNVTIIALGRVKDGGGTILSFENPNNYVHINNVIASDPSTPYGTGADDWLKAATGIKISASPKIAHVHNCEMFASDKNYDFSTTNPSSCIRSISGNTRRDGNQPEYLRGITVTVSTGTFDWQNNYGMPVKAIIGVATAGTVTAISHGYIDADGNDQWQGSGQTSGTFVVGNGQKIRIANSSAPSMVIILMAA